MIYALILLFASPVFAVSTPPMEKPTTIHKEVELQDIKHIAISGGYHVSIVKGKTASLTLSGEDAVVNKLNIKFENGELTLKPKKGKRNILSFLNFRNYDAADYRLSITISDRQPLESISLYGTCTATVDHHLRLNKIELNGASQLQMSTQNSNSQTIELSGTSKLMIDTLNVDDLLLQQTGSSKSYINHLNAKNSRVKIAGASVFNAKSIDAKTLKMRGTGQTKFGIHKANTNKIFIALHGVSEALLKSLHTDELHTSLSGSSVLTIKTGEAKHKDLNTFGIATANFGTLK